MLCSFGSAKAGPLWLMPKTMRNDRISIADYQIVNVCQTSHTLCRNGPKISGKVLVPVKLIEADAQDVVGLLFESTNTRRNYYLYGRSRRLRRAASITATSSFPIPIIASNARLAAARPGSASASVSARGVICHAFHCTGRRSSPGRRC